MTDNQTPNRCKTSIIDTTSVTDGEILHVAVARVHMCFCGLGWSHVTFTAGELIEVQLGGVGIEFQVGFARRIEVLRVIVLGMQILPVEAMREHILQRTQLLQAAVVTGLQLGSCDFVCRAVTKLVGELVVAILCGVPSGRLGVEFSSRHGNRRSLGKHERLGRPQVV